MLSIKEINLLQAQNEGLKKQNEDLQKENTELKAWLQDIKAIAEEDCKQCFEIDGFSKPDDCGICPYNKILQKITKAEEE